MRTSSFMKNKDFNEVIWTLQWLQVILRVKLTGSEMQEELCWQDNRAFWAAICWVEAGFPLHVNKTSHSFAWRRKGSILRLNWPSAWIQYMMLFLWLLTGAPGKWSPFLIWTLLMKASFLFWLLIVYIFPLQHQLFFIPPPPFIIVSYLKILELW